MIFHGPVDCVNSLRVDSGGTKWRAPAVENDTDTAGHLLGKHALYSNDDADI
jgi:hypothetical protein